MKNNMLYFAQSDCYGGAIKTVVDEGMILGQGYADQVLKRLGRTNQIRVSPGAPPSSPDAT